ncbi:hypothetical protein POUND7_008879 [Theobroma cacao]
MCKHPSRNISFGLFLYFLLFFFTFNSFFISLCFLSLFC